MSANTSSNAQTAPGPQPAPYQDRYIEVAGLKLHYQDFGTPGKTAMICVHGGAASGHWFDFIASEFTANYHVLGIDQRGHGDSEWAKTPDYTYERYAADLDEFAAKL